METKGRYLPGVTHVVTADELERIYVPGKKVELVRGVLLVQELPAPRHGHIAAELASRLREFVHGKHLGRVFADAGFRVAREPDTVRRVDVAFVSLERMPDIPPRGYPDLAPELVVEILSPGDRPGELLEKVGEWLTGGARLVWLLDPERAQARVFRADGTVSLIGPGDALDGEDVLPGLVLPLDALLRAGEAH